MEKRSVGIKTALRPSLCLPDLFYFSLGLSGEEDQSSCASSHEDHEEIFCFPSQPEKDCRNGNKRIYTIITLKGDPK